MKQISQAIPEPHRSNLIAASKLTYADENGIEQFDMPNMNAVIATVKIKNPELYWSEEEAKERMQNWMEILQIRHPDLTQKKAR